MWNALKCLWKKNKCQVSDKTVATLNYVLISEQLDLFCLYWLCLWGLPRCSLMGFDLNRHWLDPSPWAHPTLYGVKQLIIQMYNDPVSNWTPRQLLVLLLDPGKSSVVLRKFTGNCKLGIQGQNQGGTRSAHVSSALDKPKCSQTLASGVGVPWDEGNILERIHLSQGSLVTSQRNSTWTSLMDYSLEEYRNISYNWRL